jgi:DNA-binding transcriptional regulator LsrR (DeoR family)
MSDALERRIRLAEAAQRYYVDGWSQDQVAELLATSRSNVSRLLETARREGIVRFVIDHPLRRHGALEAALGDRFAVKQAVVVAGTESALDLVGRVGASTLLENLRGTLAIGWGRTVEAVISHAVSDAPVDVEVVQVGGDLTMAPAASGHELVRRLAQQLGGRHRFLHAPALVGSEATANELLADSHIAEALQHAKGADTALIGIGTPGVGFAEKAIADSYTGRQTPAAVVCARLVDAAGAELSGPLSKRVIAISLDDLAAIPHVIGVAAGADKGPAIAAALRGGLIDTLVCDQSAAAAALDSCDTTDPPDTRDTPEPRETIDAQT